MIEIKYLNQSFNDKQEMFRFLLKHKSDILSFKKGLVKRSQGVSYSIKPESASKELGINAPSGISYGSHVYPVINTTNYLDSHDDVHLDGIWNKSKDEQQGKIYFVADHKLEVDKVISRPNEVEIITKQMPWNQLGLNYNGNTEALIFKAKLTERSMKEAYDAIVNNDPVEYSIRMMYVRMAMAVNSQLKEFRDAYENWLKFFPLIANKETAEERGFFFGIQEAKILKEGSMVLCGSNDATMTLYENDNNTQPPSGTGKIEPPTGTQQIDLVKLSKLLKL